uniref:NADH-ubiquinone oxidoreductase chain 2 n=1 Tax=Cestrotus liui TaxID=1979297 RepID=A0A1W5YKA3_9MUSC|nr:NADH dehydrogenase subunit 2 [Cestrotus liui]ARI44186.1 NADH dehydrogenase subunit 2 [Cestrotus liui]
MFNNSSKIMFMLILMMGTMITVSANSWLGAWMGLEINLLSFIPLMSDTNNLMSSEASLKYFLTQALASSVLLFAIILFLMENNLFISEKIFSKSMILSALLLKSGTAPFHFWFPNVMEGLTWMNALILMTWQKIAPLMLMSYMQIKLILLICIILSTIIGSLGGLNQTSLRKLMAYSSINHLGWMISAMYSSEMMWLMYFLFYSFLSINLIYFFNLFKIFQLNQLFSLFFVSKSIKFSMFFNLLSLGGLPPFLGFLPKWLVIQMLSAESQLFLMSLLTVMTLITLYFYLRLCYSAFMMNYFEPLWISESSPNNFFMIYSLTLSFISTFGLMAINLIYLFI